MRELVAHDLRRAKARAGEYGVADVEALGYALERPSDHRILIVGRQCRESLYLTGALVHPVGKPLGQACALRWQVTLRLDQQDAVVLSAPDKEVLLAARVPRF